MLVRPGKNVRAISARDVFVIKNFACFSKCDELAVQKNYLVEKFRHRFQIVMRRDDKIPGSREAPNRFAEQILRGLVQASERLVEQKDVCVLGQGTSQKSALLLAAREGANLPFGQVGKADCSQGVVDGLRIRFAETPPDAEAHVPAHLDHVARGYRKIPIDHAALRQIGDISICSDLSVTAENDGSGFLRH